MIAHLYWRFITCALYLLPIVVSQTTIQVDDASAYSATNRNGIQFSGTDWSSSGPENPVPHFNSTYTRTTASEATAVFFFRGQAIYYFADTGPHHGYVFVSVDNGYYEYFNADSLTTGYQRTLFWVTGLDSGDHQLIISNSGPAIDANNTIAGIDYLSVVPNDDKGGIYPATLGPGASSVPVDAIVVDDNEDGHSIAYSGEWKTWSSASQSAIYFRGTMHSTKTPGDRCTFNFTGTGVWYFTDYFPGNAAVNISVDGGPSETIITASAGSIGLTQRLAWSKANLADGPHTVTLTHAGGGNYASVDFFMYLPSIEGAASSSSSTSSTGTSTSTPTSTITSETVFDVSQIPVGAIVGGSVGVLAILVLFAAFLIYMRYERVNPVKPVSGNPQTQPGSGEASGEPGKSTTTQFDWLHIRRTE
ncbi:hypothetical protein FRC07_005454 [Ceratobasidium sp. 392]|nr:hypothetical protein FRC07_005454 [Ceratobasidium sp. 392]